MKNAMKRIMSILLVALLLVSALPLAASAEDDINIGGDEDISIGDETITGDGDNQKLRIGNGGDDDGIDALMTTDVQHGLYIKVVSVPFGSSEAFPVTTDLIAPWNWHEGNDQPKSATVAQMLAKCDQNVLKDYNFYNAYYENDNKVEWSTTATFTQDVSDSIIIQVTPKVKMNVVINYKQVESQNAIGSPVTLRDRSSVSYQDVKNNIPTGTNMKLSLDRVYVISASPVDEIKEGNTYDLKGLFTTYPTQGTTIYIDAYLNTSEYKENEKPNADDVDTTPSDTTSQKATVIFTIDNGSSVTKTPNITNAAGVTISQILDAYASTFGYSKSTFQNMFVEAYKGSTQLFLNQGRVFNGETVRIYLETKTNNNGNGGSDAGSNGTVDGDDLYMSYSGTTNKDPRPVMLYVFTKNSGNGITYSADFNITSLASDDKTSLTEIRNFLKGYYNATNSDGIIADGIYEYVYNFNSSWANDTNKYENIYNLNKARNDGRVELAVVLYNAKLKSASVADSSNPKTGDSIFAPIAVLGISTAALATAMFVYNKKRAAR